MARFPGRAGSLRRFPGAGHVAGIGLVLALVAGAGVYLRIEKRVTLVVDGAPRTVVAFGSTVGDVVARADVRLATHTTVLPPLGATLVEGMTVSIESGDPSTGEPVRFLAASSTERVATRVVRERIPFPTRGVASDDLVRGEARVLREGRAGLVRSVYSVRWSAQEILAIRPVSRDVIRRPIARLMLEGTAAPTFEDGIATWYDREGMVAAHRTLPKGTSVVVTNVATGESVTVIIDDRGPFGSGRIIDLSDDAFERLAPLSRGTLWVRISW